METELWAVEYVNFSVELGFYWSYKVFDDRDDAREFYIDAKNFFGFEYDGPQVLPPVPFVDGQIIRPEFEGVRGGEQLCMF